jgi:hypothetical protein
LMLVDALTCPPAYLVTHSLVRVFTFLLSRLYVSPLVYISLVLVWLFGSLIDELIGCLLAILLGTGHSCEGGYHFATAASIRRGFVELSRGFVY